LTEPTPRKVRVVVCRGQYCNMSRRADTILKVLEPQIDALNGDAYPRPVKLEIANCLSMCGAGPNVVIYPEPTVLNDVSADDVPGILRDHIGPRLATLVTDT
jgi:(2Fe-2S) ferredoxin